MSNPRRLIQANAGRCNICGSDHAPLIQTRDGQVRVCDRCWDNWWADTPEQTDARVEATRV